MTRIIRRAGAFAAAAMLLFAAAGCGGRTADGYRGTVELIEPQEHDEGFAEIARCGGSVLSLDPSTGEICLAAGDARFYSSPQDEEGKTQERLRSQFVLYYYDENSELRSMDSYTGSVEKGQYTVSYLDDGAELTFLLGDMERGFADLPQRLTEERFAALFSDNETLSESDRKWVEKRYRKEDGCRVLRATESAPVITRMLKILDEIGYTPEQLRADAAAFGEEVAAAERVAFSVTVRYRLDEQGLHVEVPMDRFAYEGKVEPVRLSLLEFFGAATDKEDGFLLIPDGSGALAKLAPAAAGTDMYSARVYGGETARTVGETPVRLPVFAVKDGPAALFAVIEQGDAVAEINAFKSGMLCSRSGVYASFRLKESAYAVLGDGKKETEVLSFPERMYDGTVAVCYTVLIGEQADLAGMAAHYRARLIGEGVLADRAADGYPLTVHTIGAVEKTKTTLLIRHKGTQALTGFAEAGDILDRLNGDGVTQLRLQLSYWLSGIDRQKRADKCRPLSALGGRQALRELVERCRKNGVRAEGSVSVWRFAAADPLARLRSTARTADQGLLYDRPSDLVTQEPDPDRGMNVLKPSLLAQVSATVSERWTDLRIGISVADLGDRLYGDMSRNAESDRAAAMAAAQAALQAVGGGARLTVDGGNAYALAYADTVQDAPLYSSGYAILDEDVPFYSLVLHGRVLLVSEPINLADDGTQALLSAVAQGMALSCRWMAADSALLKDTALTRYYCAAVDSSYDEVLSAYRTAERLIGDLAGETIVRYEQIAPGVTVTGYEGGAQIFVNRTQQPFSVDGGEVPPLGCLRIDRR